MALSPFPKAVLIISMLLLFLVTISCSATANVDHQTSFQLMSEWPWTMSVYDDEFNANEGKEEEEEEVGDVNKRSLYWKPMPRHYYISYGALSSNRVPCPPRSGRSYYTPNCFETREPANPYTRDCSRITRCRR